MSEYLDQEKELIYALDIGTRGVVGVVGKAVDDRFKVLAIEMAEHDRRTMIDGQIDNISQVGALAKKVTQRLQEKLGVELHNVSVAAAGRALRTENGTYTLKLEQEGIITAEMISRLETAAVSAAEEKLQQSEKDRRQFFLVGYSVSQYRLDNYPLTALLDHTGSEIAADVVATFLPGEVVESLYAAMRMAGLQVSSMTLEPIAAMNAAIPAELRLLNLALVDIGAGTTDIAICRDGSVVGYTMTTIAGDEITEAVMRKFLVDFKTAERMKRVFAQGEDISYRNILGLDDSCSCEEFQLAIEGAEESLAKAVAEQVIELNGSAPSALFLAGGGSKLNGLKQKVAQQVGIDDKRLASAGANFEKSAFSDEVDIMNPELATPLGLAVSAGMGLLNDSYMIMLNDKPAKLFRSGMLTVKDILLMNGYTYADMIARTGKNVSITVDGSRVTLRGEVGIPAVLTVNGLEAAITQIIQAGDKISFAPARAGADAAATAADVVADSALHRILVNSVEVAPDAILHTGDVITTVATISPEEISALSQQMEQQMEQRKEPAQPVPAEPKAEPEKSKAIRKPIEVNLNDKALWLAGKEDGQPYYLMDLLEKTNIDFDHLDCPVHIELNGTECGFTDEVKDGDSVKIYCDRKHGQHF